MLQAPSHPPVTGPRLIPGRMSWRGRIMVGMTDTIESTLPPYTADRPHCSKCGHDKASTNYSPAQRRCVCQTPTDTGERLCRLCDRCGHHWDEALATNDQAAPFRDRLPLGQQFKTNLAYLMSGETHLILTHMPSGLHWTTSYPRPQLAEAAEQPLLMFQRLLDQVDDWQRQPIEAPGDHEETR